jgi:hypothetical protein
MMVDSVHGSWTAGGAGHGGLQPWPAEGLTGARPSGLSGARWLTDDGAMESGARGASVSDLTVARVAVW